MIERANVFCSALMGDTDGILAALDGAANIVWISPEVKRVLGYDAGDVIGRPVEEFLASDEPGEGQRKIRDLMAAPAFLLRTVHDLRHRDGSRRTMELVGRDLRHDPEVAAVVIHMRDITEQRRVVTSLMESHARLEEACRIAGLGWWRLDDATGRLEFSDELLRLSGWQRQPDATWRTLLKTLVHPEDRRLVRAAMAGRPFALHPVELELRVTLPGIGTRHWLVHARREEAMPGQPNRLSGTVLDVTERRNAEAELLHAQKLEALDLLAAGIAHDFNNLLAVVQANVALAKEADSQAEAQSLLCDAEEACARAGDLSRQLLTYARGEESRALQPTELGHLLRTMVPFLLHGTSIRADVRAAESLRPVSGDAGELSQVVQNLVLNAAAAMPDGGTLEVHAENATLPDDEPSVPLPAGRHVHILVRDTGYGISPEHLPRIFDPFYSTRAQGHGLGLATTHRIVRRHRGYIRAESIPGSGAVFHIYLPAIPDPNDRSDAARSTAPTGALPKHLRVLLVDDEALVRTGAARMLQTLGCDVATAAGSEEALSLFRVALGRGRPFQVAILDITMPEDLGAAELFRRLWSIDPMLHGVVTSGYADHDTMVHFRRSGFRASLPKPYGLDELRSTLLAAVDDHPDPMPEG